MEPTWGPSGADKTQVGPMLAPWTFLSGLALGLCKGTVGGLCKTMEIPNGYVSPRSIADCGNPNLYLIEPITKLWCHPTGVHVSYPTDSPTATSPGLCSSLIGASWPPRLNAGSLSWLLVCFMRQYMWMATFLVELVANDTTPDEQMFIMKIVNVAKKKHSSQNGKIIPNGEFRI